MTDQLSQLFTHLRLESDFLDSLIQSSRDVQAILRNRVATDPSTDPSRGIAPRAVRNNTSNPSATSLETSIPSYTGEQPQAQLQDLHQQMLRLAKPLIQSRRQLPEILRSLSQAPDQITLTAIASRLDQPIRSQLMDLRREIRAKMDQVYAISMGNQAVLIYTMDFYDRLLPGSRTDAGCYNATGQTQNQYDAGVVRNHC